MGRPPTPMLRQYLEAKQVFPEALLMFRMGDFFELFYEDARLAAEICELTLTARDKGTDAVPMAGVPHQAVNGYVARLVAAGHQVALCDQVEDPKVAKGLVRREVVRLVTPGTQAELEALDAQAQSLLAAVVPVAGDAAGAPEPGGAPAPSEPGLALALFDLLAGETQVGFVPAARLGDELARLGACELLVPPPLMAHWRPALSRHKIWVRAAAADEGAGRDGAPDSVDAAAALWRRLHGPVAPLWAGRAGADALARAWLALMHFAEASQRRPLAHLSPPRWLSVDEGLGLDEATRRNLELCQTALTGRRAGSLLAHLDQTRTALGARLLRRWLLRPSADPARIQRRADAVAALVSDRTLRETLRGGLRAVRDIERLAGRVALGRANPRDLQGLGTSLGALSRLRGPLVESATPLGALWQASDFLAPLTARLAAALVDEPPTADDAGGIFRRGFDPALDELIDLCDEGERLLGDFEAAERQRTGISSLKVRHNRVFGMTLEVTRTHLKRVPADYVRRQTLAGAERFVTPALAALEQRLGGARSERCAREHLAFGALCDEVLAELPALRRLSRLVAQSDALASLAEVAEHGRWVRPRLAAAGAPIVLQGSRHPVLEALMPGGERFVPNDVSLGGEGRQLLVVTGPNMAGKSTVMRQVALAAILAQMGSFVPADAAEVGLCDQVFTRVGAGEDLGRGMSTFMVEMSETAAILARATPTSVVLVDEIGRGTSTFDGLSIAQAVAEHLVSQTRCRAMFATHYHELAALAEAQGDVANVSMAAGGGRDGMVFSRRLVEGPSAHSLGVQVAALAGLPATVLGRAEALLAELEASRPGGTAVGRREAPAATPPSDAGPGPAEALARALEALDLDGMSPWACAEALRRLREQWAAACRRSAS